VREKHVTETVKLDVSGDAVVAPITAHYVLSLYITGYTAQSARAISNLRKICEENINGRYELEIVDLSQHPALAKGEQIVAAPTLIKKLPLPLRRFIGDMSRTERILIGLDLGGSPEDYLQQETRQ